MEGGVVARHLCRGVERHPARIAQRRDPERTAYDEALPAPTVATRRFRARTELDAVYAWRRAAFTGWWHPARLPWLRSAIERVVTDSLAAHYPDHHFEARTADGRLVGVLFTAPVAWDGDEATLGTFDRHVRANYWRALSPINLFTYIVLVLVLRAPRAFARVAAALHRRERQRTTGILLLEILVDPAAQGQGVAGALFAEAAARTRAAGGRWLMSPFRPSGYGRHKSAARAGHDAGTFSGYCALRDRGGRLVDPWLRFLDGHGVRFFRLEPESHIVRRSRRHFDRFRADHRPGDWYEAAPGLWECGETQCWRIEGDRVAAVEPNVWGRLDLTGKAT